MQVVVKARHAQQTINGSKETLKFYVKGEDENKRELSDLTRLVVHLTILHADGNSKTIMAEFKSSKRDSNHTVLDFEVKNGQPHDNVFDFYKRAGEDIVLKIEESQMDIDDFRDEQKKYREGVKGTINNDGTVDVDPNQLTTDDYDDDDDPMQDAGEDNDDSDDDGLDNPNDDLF